MSLSCSCDFEPQECAWYWSGVSEFKLMGVSARRKKCCSCGDVINSNHEVIEFYRYRSTLNDIEERIYGDEKQLASHFMCEECGGLYLALDELGYGCLDISKPMKDYVIEYNEMRR